MSLERDVVIVSKELLQSGSLTMYWTPHDSVQEVWPQVEGFVEKTLRKQDHALTLQSIRTSLLYNEMQLFTVLEEGELHTVCIAELLRDGRGNKTCRIVALAGHDLLHQDLFRKCLEEWARINGCIAMEADVTEAGYRLFKKFGYAVEKVKIVKEL